MKQKLWGEIELSVMKVMKMFSIFIVLLIFISINKYCYMLSILIKGKFLIKKYDLNIEHTKLQYLNYYYLVSLPTNETKLYMSLPRDFDIKFEFENFLFPSFSSVGVYYKNNVENKLILSIRSQDINLVNKNFNDEEKQIFIQYLLFSKNVQLELKQEICKKLRERKLSI